MSLLFSIIQLLKKGKNAFPLEIPFTTNEIRIGTWIDGKPIYRRVYSATMITGTTTPVASIPNFRELVSVKGYVKYNDGYHGLGGYANDNFYNLVQVKNNGAITVWCKASSGYASYPVLVIVEYTKTTD